VRAELRRLWLLKTYMFHERLAPVSHPPIYAAPFLRLGLERDLEPSLEVEELVEVREDEMGRVLGDKTVLDERARVGLQRKRYSSALRTFRR
jgi:hypothetical protein